MKIEKVLNNNVVVILNEKGIETIVMGRGIAYKKKVGDEVDQTKVDKEFLMTTMETNNRFQELIVDIPLEFLEMGEEIIVYAKTHLGKKINETIYISLVDHIYTAVIRSKDGINVKNALLWDIKRFYPDEFAVGLHSLDMIEEKMGVRLLKDEAGFIALHIVNAQMDDDMKDVYEITNIMQEISTIVKYNFNVDFDEDSVYFYRFITHLKFFSQRLLSGSTYEDDRDDDLLDLIRLKYKNSFECVNKIGKFILEKYNYTISNEEKLYLTIHIERVIYKSEK